MDERKLMLTTEIIKKKRKIKVTILSMLMPKEEKNENKYRVVCFILRCIEFFVIYMYNGKMKRKLIWAYY